MKKILVTGSTSSHVSNDANKRSTRFSGLINCSLSYSGTDSVIKSLPISSAKDDIKIFDSVVVGLSPVSSLSAHKTYSALNTIGICIDTDKPFTIVFDAPEPHLVFKSYCDILKNPDLLVKNLYKTREGYSEVNADKNFYDNILGVIEVLSTGDFDVIIPSVPYFEGSREIYGIPSAKRKSITAINFDRLFENNYHNSVSKKHKYWSIEDDKQKWSKTIVPALKKPVIKLKRSQYDFEIDYIDRLQGSYGYLLPVYKNNVPWWSRNIMLSLSAGTPVFSDWRHTQKLGDCWYRLPQDVEDLSEKDRYEIAMEQREIYISNLSSWEESSRILIETVLK